jgi:hypothetical protein
MNDWTNGPPPIWTALSKLVHHCSVTQSHYSKDIISPLRIMADWPTYRECRLFLLNEMAERLKVPVCGMPDVPESELMKAYGIPIMQCDSVPEGEIWLVDFSKLKPEVSVKVVNASEWEPPKMQTADDPEQLEVQKENDAWLGPAHSNQRTEPTEW